MDYLCQGRKFTEYICSCEGLMLLETYTTAKGDELKLPDFLNVEKEVRILVYFIIYLL